MTDYQQAMALNDLARICHEANWKWWLDLSEDCPECGGGCGIRINDKEILTCEMCRGTGHPKLTNRNIPEMLMLMVSEIAEAMEGHRKNLMDEKLPHRRALEVELADLLIRVFDFAGGIGLDLGGALIEKQAFNRARKDHTLEARKSEGGKAY
jgi:NTP pyrophosphatase (non-canonical NTP hydrolase)